MPRRYPLAHTAAALVILLASLAALVHLAGFSPIVWMDSFNDEVEVRRCLADDSCTLTGVQTSIRGLYHAVSWLEFRTLAAWLGASLEQAHGIALILNALAVALVFYLATRLGGSLAGSFAAVIFIHGIDGVIPIAAVHNSVLLFSLGAVLLLACTAVALRPSAMSVTLAALVAAIVANTHLVGSVAGVSVVLVSLAARGRTLPLALFGGAVFAGATVAIAPMGWAENSVALLQLSGERTKATTLVADNPAMTWALFATAAFALSLLVRSPAAASYRRRASGAIAVFLPLMAVFLVSSRLGFAAEAKYLIHAKAALAVACALPLAALLAAAFEKLRATRLRAALHAFAPIIAAGVIAGPAWTASATIGYAPTLTVGDLAQTVNVLTDELGWSTQQILRRLKSPHGIATLTGAVQMAARYSRQTPVQSSERTTAFLVAIRADQLPDPMPPGWRVLRRSQRSISILAIATSAIDWSTLEICRSTDTGTHSCVPGQWSYSEQKGIRIEQMPSAGGGWRGDLRLRFSLEQPAANRVGIVSLPRSPLICGGSVVSVSEGPIAVAANRRSIEVATSPDTDTRPRPLEIHWEIGSSDCRATTYDGLPPFFLEGARETIAPLADALARRQTRSRAP